MGGDNNLVKRHFDLWIKRKRCYISIGQQHQSNKTWISNVYGNLMDITNLLIIFINKLRRFRTYDKCVFYRFDKLKNVSIDLCSVDLLKKIV